MTKKSVFALFTVALVLFLFAVLELLLRAVDYGDDMAFFYEHPQLPGYLLINPELGKRYFPKQQEQPQVSTDAFRVEKPGEGLRVFVLGGSSAAGYPWFHNGAFSRMLAQRLLDQYPERSVEVVNLAMPAVNSYTVLDVARNVIKYKPDFLLVYAGHNEFYGALGVASSETAGGNRWLVRTYLGLRHWRLFQLLQNGINGITAIFSAPPEKRDQRTLMERMVKNQRIAYNSPRYKTALTIFRENMIELAELAQQNDVALILSEVVSNESDLPPFESMPETVFHSAWLDLIPQQPAYRAVREYLQKQPGDAALHFRLARQLETDAYYGRAQRHYQFAKDLDGLRFRASEDLNRELKRVAGKYALPFIPLRSILQQKSGHGLIGNNWMLEHLHPKLQGQFELAGQFARAMTEAIPAAASALPDSFYRAHLAVTPLDTIIAHYRLRVLQAGWPFTDSSRVEQVIAGFSPQTLEEKLALDVWLQKTNWYDAHVQLARYYLQNNRLELAAAEHEALALERPYDINLQNKLAEILILQKNYMAAKRALRRSLQAQENLFALRMLGSLLVNEGKLQEGIPFLERALQKDENDAQALYNIAGAHALLGQWEKSRSYLERLLKVQPQHRGGRALLQQLRQNLQ